MNDNSDLEPLISLDANNSDLEPLIEITSLDANNSDLEPLISLGADNHDFCDCGIVGGCGGGMSFDELFSSKCNDEDEGCAFSLF